MLPTMNSCAMRFACLPFHMNRATAVHGHDSGIGVLTSSERREGSTPIANATHQAGEKGGAPATKADKIAWESRQENEADLERHDEANAQVHTNQCDACEWSICWWHQQRAGNKARSRKRVVQYEGNSGRGPIAFADGRVEAAAERRP